MPLEEPPWPFPPNNNVPRLWRISSKITVAAVGISSKIWADWFTTTVVYNKKALTDAVEKRAAGRPLVTVSNHHSCVDDPMLWGVLSLRTLVPQNEKMRWTLAASDICFTKKWHSWFFSRGRCVPVVRGNGVYQRSMNFMVDQLNEGGWVHMFPEGKVNLTHEFMRLKWGVGRLIADCKELPLVLPFWHLGMDDVLPNHSPYVPRIGKKVTVLVGDPIDFSEVLEKMRAANKSPMEIRKRITDLIQEELKLLKEKAEKIHYRNS